MWAVKQSQWVKDASKDMRGPYSSDSNDNLGNARPEGLGGSRGHTRVDFLCHPGRNCSRGRHGSRGRPFGGVQLGESHGLVVQATPVDHFGIGQASFAFSEELGAVIGRYMPLRIAATASAASGCCCGRCC